MDTIDPLRFIFAFLFVIGLIGVLAMLLRRYGNSQNIWGQKLFSMKEEDGRIKLVEQRWLDPKRRLVLVKRDEVEHLLLLADGREVVIEAGIEVKDDK